MKSVLALAVAALAFGSVPFTTAQAAGCASGAAMGGVAGHVAGHHALLGAAAGCAVGHHMNAKQQKAAATPAAPATQPQ